MKGKIGGGGIDLGTNVKEGGDGVGTAGDVGD